MFFFFFQLKGHLDPINGDCLRKQCPFAEYGCTHGASFHIKVAITLPLITDPRLTIMLKFSMQYCRMRLMLYKADTLPPTTCTFIRSFETTAVDVQNVGCMLLIGSQALS